MGRRPNTTKLDQQEQELVGSRVGRLTVVRYTGTQRHLRRLYECLCDCGETHYTSDYFLLRNRVSACWKCTGSHKPIPPALPGEVWNFVYRRWGEYVNQDRNEYRRWVSDYTGPVVRLSLSHVADMDRIPDMGTQPESEDPGVF